MKTLAEVIKALRCTDPEVDPETKCNDCPYKELHIDELWYVGPSCLDEMFADALHYLKVLQKMQKAQPLEKSEWNELYNQPLTWDELKTMEGKPVFVEERYRNGDLKSSGWWLIDFWNDDQICMRDSAGNPWNEHRSNYGRDWQAYRKERE